MITQEYLKECLEYNSETGVFTWRERPLSHFKSKAAHKMWNNRFSGKATALCCDKRGYPVLNLNNKIQRAHRLVWILVNGHIGKEQIDHINGDRTDNRLCNLREASKNENSQNQRKAISSNKSTGLLGTSFNKQHKKFEAYINKDGKRIRLGLHSTAEEAHEAYLKAKRALHPFCTI